MKIKWFLLALILLLTGCVRMDQGKTGSQDFTFKNKWARQATLQELTRWSIRGALSIQQPGESEIANYSWWQQGQQNYRITLASSLNLYQITVTGANGQVQLRRGSRDVIQASTPEALLQRSLGWQLPVSNLYYWVRGLPATGRKVASYDRYGHLATLRQSGWRVQYHSYTHYGRLDLPRKITMRRNGIKVTFVIKSWSFS